MDFTAPQLRRDRGASTSGFAPPMGVPAKSNTGHEAANKEDSVLIDATASKSRTVTRILLGVIGLLFICFCVKYSLYLAANRIYQVDECENVFVARILASGRAGQAFSTLSLFHLPFVWLAHHAITSVKLFYYARLVSVVVFWTNVVLLTVATGERLFSRRGLTALIGAGTLAPLWDYGFEVRHDNLLLTGLLSTWCVMRLGRGRIPSYVILGALAVAMQFTAFKAFVYTVPLTVGFMVFPPSGKTAPRWKLMLAWASGALAMFLLIRAAYGSAGLWGLYLSNFHRVTTDATGSNRFAPWFTLHRLLVQTPLLLATLLTGLSSLLWDWRRRGRVVLTWDAPLPEAFLFLLAFAALIINPAPYPYNLVNLVPFAFLFAFRYGSMLSTKVWSQPVLRPFIVAILIFGHFLPFALATSRHLDWPNYRQQKLMRLAEELTDPKKDPVYDGVGMVPTRSSIGFHWFLHSLNISSFTDGGISVQRMLTTRPAAVIIPNYRTDWLPVEDHQFIEKRYVPLADDFWVLGCRLPVGGGTFEIFHDGRYCIVPLQKPEASDDNANDSEPSILPEADKILTGTLDGARLQNHPIKLKSGKHRIITMEHCEVGIVWIGPHLDKLPKPGPGDHKTLFVNWY